MILAIETATDVCGVALVHGGRVIGERSVNEKKIHSEKLLPMIDEILRGAMIPLSSVDAIAVSIGPGSFTGLRIGLSAAKGLACARHKPIVAVPTLDALAFEYFRGGGARDGDTVCPVIDAKRDEGFFCFYGVSTSGIARSALYEIAVVSKIAEAAAVYGSVTFVGDGAAKMEMIAASNGSFRSAPHIVCSPVSVGFVAENEGRRLADEEFVMLEPMYIRDFLATQPGGKRYPIIQKGPAELPPITHSPKE